METKHCSKCGQDKPLSEFYKSARGGCRACVRRYQNQWYHEHKVLKRQPVPDGMRHCKKCEQTKPLDEFYRDRSNASGYHHYCKTCSDELKRVRLEKQRRASRVEDLPEGHKRCSICGEILPSSEFDLIWKNKTRRHAKCKKCVYEERLLRRARSGLPPPRPKRLKLTEEEELQYRRDYRQRLEVQARSREHNRIYRQDPTHQRKARKKTIEWRRANPERCREQTRIKRLRRKDADGEHTRDQWEELLKMCGGGCLYCGTTKKITRDHIIALTWGGSDRIDNIQPLCHKHNGTKRDSYAVDYRPRHVRRWAFQEAQDGHQNSNA